MAFLDDNKPARSQFRCPRRAKPSGVMVVHTAENTPDFVAFDGGAEAVANFIRNRTDAGSYHDLADSDSSINLVRYECEAFQDGTGSNPHAWGGSIATRADVWPLAPKEWRDGAVRQLAAAAARYARWVKANHGIVVPARRINRGQSEMRTPGFISHAERDPARRTDPGAAFPWTQFLNEYARQMGQPTEDDMSAAEVDQILDAIGVVRGKVETTYNQVNLRTGALSNKIDAVATAVEADPPADVDETALAAALIPLLVSPLVAAFVAELPAEVTDQLSLAEVEDAMERAVRRVAADAATPDVS